MRTHDWSASPLGSPESWPQSLRTVASLILTSKFPMFVAWGRELGFLYNDAYAPILGSKHPRALGRRFDEIWSEIWTDISPLIDRALAGEATYSENLPLTIERRGFTEESSFTFSYSPVRDESGGIGGMFCACVETTQEVEARRALNADRERLRQYFHQAPGFMALFRGPDHIIELTNAAYLQLVGHRELAGKSVRDALPEVAGQGFFELLDAVYATGEPFVGRQLPLQIQRRPNAQPEERFVDFVYQPVTDSDGRVTGIFVEGSDVTERIRAEAQVRERTAALEASNASLLERETDLRSALGAAAMATFAVDYEAGLVQGSSRLNELYGYPPDQPLTIADLRARYHPDDRATIAQFFASMKDPACRTFDMPFRLLLPSGAVRWVSGKGEFLRDENGHVCRSRGVVIDITDRKRWEERQQLLINELNHRVKNTLATVQSVVTQTLRTSGTMAQVRPAIERRLIALSRTHDVLTRENWEGANLREIVADAIEPYLSYGIARIRCRGPEVRLSARMALALAMALQELATNAVKYGALSNAAGEVDLSWSVDRSPATPLLHLTWSERGGPPVEPPKHRGFGTRLIERSLAQDLDGQVIIDFARDGLVCTVRAPIV